jgi:hypothetical protein
MLRMPPTNAVAIQSNVERANQTWKYDDHLESSTYSLARPTRVQLLTPQCPKRYNHSTHQEFLCRCQ